MSIRSARGALWRALRVVVGVGGWAAVAAGGAVLASVAAQVSPVPLLGAAQAAGWLWCATAAVVVAAGLAARRPHLWRAAAMVSLCWLALAGSGVMAARRPVGDGPRLEVASANLLKTNPTMGDATAALGELDVDVLVTVETTKAARAQLDTTLGPLRPVATGDGVQGDMVVVWTDLPVLEVRRVQLTWWSLPAVTVDVDGRPVTVVGTHLAAPSTPDALGRWKAQAGELAAWVASQDGAVVLAGDFNASADQPGLQALFAHADDAARADGHLWVRTWPARDAGGWGVSMPILGLDHVVVRHASASGYHQFAIPGSDHLGVAATVTVGTDRR